MTPRKSAFERFTANHLPHCKMKLYSLQAERVCTCGRDELIKQWEELKKRAEIVQLEMAVMR